MSCALSTAGQLPHVCGVGFKVLGGPQSQGIVRSRQCVRQSSTTCGVPSDVQQGSCQTSVPMPAGPQRRLGLCAARLRCGRAPASSRPQAARCGAGARRPGDAQARCGGARGVRRGAGGGRRACSGRARWCLVRQRTVRRFACLQRRCGALGPFREQQLGVRV